MKIPSSVYDYEVQFSPSDDFLASFLDIGERCIIVDENVYRCHRNGCLKVFAADSLTVFPVSEERKTLDSVLEIYDLLTARAAKRNLTLISIGGGILQDLTGFAASTLYRGIPWIYVPTTLLAQSDSCIGSKTSLNYKRFKNLLGTFYPPRKVFIHTPFLATLDEVDFYSGVGEVVKLHIMGGEATTCALIGQRQAIARRDPAALHQAVEASLMIKRGYIVEDEFDAGRRNMLNFGHCFGHAIESAAEFAVPHGQAVILGMLLANIVARKRGLLSQAREQYFADELLVPSLKVLMHGDYLRAEVVIDGMKKDKKRLGENLALIMIDDKYEMSKVNDLTTGEAGEALGELTRILKL